MDLSAIPCGSSAIVLWLPKGEKPRGAEHFNIEAQRHPPVPNPEPWWNLEKAVLKANASHEQHGKLPWIKVGDVILSPDDVSQAYEFFKHHGTRK